MKRLPKKGVATAEILFLIVYFASFAYLLLVSDPAWLIWAGPITLGAFPTVASGVAPSIEPHQLCQAASYSILPGLLALFILEGIREEKSGAAPEAQETRKAA